MPYAELSDLRLWYEDSGGRGFPVIFLHPISGTWEIWAQQLPAFTAAGYRCVAYDRCGSGRTRRSGTDSAGTHAGDLQGLIEHLGFDRFHLVGSAAGGGVAFDYAVSHPERIRCLVVADAGGGFQDEPYVAFQQRLRPPEIQALPIELREVSAGYRGQNPDGLRRWIEIERGSRTEVAGAPRQRTLNRLTLAQLAALSMPVLILAGEADLLTPPALMRLPAAAITGCEFATIPEAGHAAFWEQPDTWNRIVLEFLRAH